MVSSNAACQVPAMTDQLTHAIIVAFHPDIDQLRTLAKRLLEQVGHVHIMDNTPSDSPRFRAASAAFSGNSQISVVPFGRNLGVATALNNGIRNAIAAGASHVLLSDQDSLPMQDMVARLMSTLRDFEAHGVMVAVVGPDFVNDIDTRSFLFEHVDSRWPIYRSTRPSIERPVIEVVAVISSGSLIPINALNAIGGMCDSLFIDYVDLEWCERARARGYVCLADGRATMSHKMGEDRLRFWLMRWRTISRYGGVRLRYQARNVTYLATRPGVTWRFRVGAIWFLLGKLYAYSVTLDARGKSVLALGRGIIAGLLGRLGPN